MKTVVLVPRRDDGGHRDRVWAWCRAWWERELGWPIYEGHHRPEEGLFNRAAACNRAAAAAGAWDVAVLIDSDVFCDPGKVREAVKLADRSRDHLILPFTLRHNLNQAGSARIMAGDTGSWRSYIAITYRQQCSAVVVIPRELWDKVGGFDEQFVGWGFEDNAFACAAETYGRSLEMLPDAELWHLWHPTAKEGKRHSPSYRANRARHELYRAALGDQAATRRLLDGSSEAPVAIRERENIPRILHRVVPATTTPEVEAWWARFERLHPGWQSMTHRDPLDPHEWPITAKAWPRCSSGAQLAGLVRLEALWRYGGIYVDSDCEPYRSLEELLPLRAFAAWEDAKVIPDAVIGAEPEHPAIRACLDLALRRVAKGAWASGPGVTTEVFSRRSDVTVLPPGAFYPYHYTEKHRRGEDHAKAQPWAFMAHHWAGSWLDKSSAAERPTRPEPVRVPPATPSTTLSFLVPFRDADGSRARAKDWILARWAAHYPDAEFVLGSDDGTEPFNKSAAVNDAATRASGEMFVILDADTWIDSDAFGRAVELVTRGQAPWAIPARRSYRLTRGYSEQLLALDPAGPLPEFVPRRSTVEARGYVVGFCHIVPRAAFELVGGMDDRFRGWGGEDTSFARALDVVVGRHVQLNGRVLSLWHERPTKHNGRGRMWRGQTLDHDRERAELAARYAKARTREQMLALTAEHAA